MIIFLEFSRYDVFALVFIWVPSFEMTGNVEVTVGNISVFSMVSSRRLAFIRVPSSGCASCLTSSTRVSPGRAACVAVRTAFRPTGLETCRLDYRGEFAVVVDVCCSALGFVIPSPLLISRD